MSRSKSWEYWARSLFSDLERKCGKSVKPHQERTAQIESLEPRLLLSVRGLDDEHPRYPSDLGNTCGEVLEVDCAHLEPSDTETRVGLDPVLADELFSSDESLVDEVQGLAVVDASAKEGIPQAVDIRTVDERGNDSVGTGEHFTNEHGVSNRDFVKNNLQALQGPPVALVTAAKIIDQNKDRSTRHEPTSEILLEILPRGPPVQETLHDDGCSLAENRDSLTPYNANSFAACLDHFNASDIGNDQTFAGARWSSTDTGLANDRSIAGISESGIESDVSHRSTKGGADDLYRGPVVLNQARLDHLAESGSIQIGGPDSGRVVTLGDPSDNPIRGPPQFADVQNSLFSMSRLESEPSCPTVVDIDAPDCFTRLAPSDPTGTIGIGDGAEGDFFIDQAFLDSLTGSRPITIGSPDGSHLIQIGDATNPTGAPVTFSSPVTLSAPQEGGEIHILSDLVGLGDASLTIRGSGHTTTIGELDGSIKPNPPNVADQEVMNQIVRDDNGNTVDVHTTVTVAGDIVIDDSVEIHGIVKLVSQSGNIAIGKSDGSGTVSDGGNGSKLTLEAPAGNIDINSSVDLPGLTAVAGGDWVRAKDITAGDGNVSLTAPTVYLDGNIKTTGTGGTGNVEVVGEVVIRADVEVSSASGNITIGKSDYSGTITDDGMEFKLTLEAPEGNIYIPGAFADQRSRLTLEAPEGNIYIRSSVDLAGHIVGGVGVNKVVGPNDERIWATTQANSGWLSDSAAKFLFTLPIEFNRSALGGADSHALKLPDHGLETGQAVIYQNLTRPPGADIGNLTDNTIYYVIRQDADKIKLATSVQNMSDGTPITLAKPTAAGTYRLTPIDARTVNTFTQAQITDASHWITLDNHALVTGQEVRLNVENGNAPNQLVNNTDYTVIVVNDDTVKDTVKLSQSFGQWDDGTIIQEDNDRHKTQAIKLNDLNKDGHLDLVVGNEGKNRIHFGKGDGTFQPGRDIHTESDKTNSIALGDLNQDGYLDLVVGNDGQNRIYLGQQGGTFDTSNDIHTESDKTHSIALGDVDNDGHLDLVVGNYGKLNRCYLGKGDGTFHTGQDIGTASDKTNSIALGDLNRDGLLDLVAGNDSVNKYYNGKGNCTFNKNNGVDVVKKTVSVVLGDLNGDGYPDLVTGNAGGHAAQRERVYLNDKNGEFKATPTTFVSSTDHNDTRSMVLKDLNQDGDLDLVVGSKGVNKYYLGNGDGTFKDSENVATHSHETNAIAVGL